MILHVPKKSENVEGPRSYGIEQKIYFPYHDNYIMK